MRKTGLLLIVMFLFAQAVLAADQNFGKDFVEVWDPEASRWGISLSMYEPTTLLSLYELSEPGTLQKLSIYQVSEGPGAAGLWHGNMSAAIYNEDLELVAYGEGFELPGGDDWVGCWEECWVDFDIVDGETKLLPGNYYLAAWIEGYVAVNGGVVMPLDFKMAYPDTYDWPDWEDPFVEKYEGRGSPFEIPISIYGTYTPAVVPTVEITSIEGNPTNTSLPHFSSANDGTITIAFTATNPENDTATIDLNYSTQAVQGTGTPILTNEPLDTECIGINCIIELDISAIEEGEYYILAALNNWALEGFDSAENSFAIDATAPEATVTKMNEENVAGVLLSFNAEEENSITIDFDMLDAVGGNIVVDVNYSLQNIEGTGTILEKGLALDAIVCEDEDFTNPTECTVTLDLTEVPNGSYYINILSKDGLFTSFKTMVAPVQIYRPSAPESGELPPFCGDKKCNGNEWAGICPTDCSQACGDTACTHTESIATCSADCFGCGDNICAIGENNQTCPADCLTLTCGDSQCSEGENCLSCSADCGTCEVMTVIAETPLGEEQTTDQKIKTQRFVTVEGAMLGDNSPVYRTKITIQVTNVSGNDLSDIKIKEILREEVAGNISELKTDAEFIEVFGENAIEFILQALAKGETAEIVYFVEKNINTEALAGWNAPTVLEMQEVIGTAKSCNKDRDCDDSNPCTKELCITGQCGIIPELDGTICGQLKECRQMKCADIMVEKAGPQEDSAPFTYATIATTAVIIIAGYYLTKKYI